MAGLSLAQFLDAEWLEADGLGGFASGTASGIRTRRYHALLLAATTPPTGRVVLVNGIEAWVETGAGSFPLSAQRYAPDVIYPDGSGRIVAFEHEPWPRWTFRLEDGTEVVQEVIVAHATSSSSAQRDSSPTSSSGAHFDSSLVSSSSAPRDSSQARVLLRWRRLRGPDGATLVVRPLLSGRDYHSLHHENGAFDFTALPRPGAVAWRPYPDLPAVVAHSNGEYRHEPVWYRNFLYAAELARGLDALEDLAAPGSFTFALDREEAVLILRAAPTLDGVQPTLPATARAGELADRETERRRGFASPLHRAADQYVVRRGQGRTIVAGYPWFTDWGRDTFITLRGFMGLPGGLELARDILLAWAPTVSEGMVPNRFPDGGDTPEYNAVDASLWYAIAAHEFLELAASSGALVQAEAEALHEAVASIVAGYRAGTRFAIRMADDGLLAAGVPGVQLTWMDAKVGDHVITPRIGKPVEVQALWLNALAFASVREPALRALHERALASFRERFWNQERGCLYDVVDLDHVPGANDPAIRPNQILAVGGLPDPLIEGERARGVVEVVGRELLTPLGLRSLAPGEPGYRPLYRGGVWERDSAYHQGTVWPWLLGPFVEAWLRVHGDAPDAGEEAERRFLAPLRQHLDTAGLGHVSEVADADPPHAPGGCPFQAWSLAELLRASRLVEAVQGRAAPEPQGRRA